MIRDICYELFKLSNQKKNYIACCNIFNQIFETNISSDTLTIDQNLSQNQNDSTNWLDVFNCFKFWKLLCAIVIAVHF